MTLTQTHGRTTLGNRSSDIVVALHSTAATISPKPRSVDVLYSGVLAKFCRWPASFDACGDHDENNLVLAILTRLRGYASDMK